MGCVRPRHQPECHFLLMTATPHNGNDADFQLFMGLLDPDRFEGRPREGARKVDVSDLMRRLTKEELRKFDGSPLFPERKAYTVEYKLSDLEAQLYAAVTQYVRNEMRNLNNLAGDDKRRNNVGFALQILQRRLASSPAAIYHSLRRRFSDGCASNTDCAISFQIGCTLNWSTGHMSCKGMQKYFS